jgi:hypothetical protein
VRVVDEDNDTVGVLVFVYDTEDVGDRVYPSDTDAVGVLEGDGGTTEVLAVRVMLVERVLDKVAVVVPVIVGRVVVPEGQT